MEITSTHNRVNLKRLGALLLGLVTVCAIAITVPSSAVAQSERGRVAINQDLTVGRGEIVIGAVNVTGGNLEMLGEVHGNITVVNGSATIDGKVLGNVTVLANGTVSLEHNAAVFGNILGVGDVTLESGSLVTGNVNTFSGNIEKAAGAHVNGVVGRLPGDLPVLGEIASTPPLVAPGATGKAHSWSGSTWVNRVATVFATGVASLVLLVLSVLAVVVAPRRVSNASLTLHVEPGPSIVVGAIAGVLLGPALALITMLLVISIVGWILLPVLVVGVLALLLLGLVTVGAWLGRWVYDGARQTAAHPVAPLMVQVLIGMAILLGSTLLPSAVRPGFLSVVMIILLYMVTCIGLGALFLSRFGKLAPTRHAHMQPFPSQPGSPAYVSTSPPGSTVRLDRSSGDIQRNDSGRADFSA